MLIEIIQTDKKNIRLLMINGEEVASILNPSKTIDTAITLRDLAKTRITAHWNMSELEIVQEVTFILKNKEIRKQFNF